ncbi:MAG TPA: C45 family peptidase [Thermomicrobiaceae bacterium]|nr:C45 family peptidase [Thermomicrobiaceae bacterium]
MGVDDYPIITVRDGAYERGRQHGEQARDRVGRTVEIYRAAFSNTAGLSWPDALERAAGFARVIGTQDPAILEEMRGIGDGAGFSLEEIVAVNCRTEILYGGRKRGIPDPTAHECTTIAVSPWASASGTTLLGKNWDWKAACRESVIVLQVAQDDGPDFVMTVEAGMVGRDGFNAAGIAICGNLLRSVHDGGKPGDPVPIIRRRALNSTRLDAAFGAVLDANRSASTNYVIAHESGVIVDFEASPEQVYPVYPERGLLTHSNHFTAVAAQVQGIGLLTGPDTLYRHQRVRDLLEPKIGQITVEDVQQALTDHVGYPRSVCRHPEGPEGTDQTMSIASVVIDLGARVMYVASGPPCSHPFREVRLPAAAGEGARDARHAGVAAG